jgi:SAM-dependent methyltransferase
LSLHSRTDPNRAWWDERVPIHVGSAFYDVDGFRAGGSSLRPFEIEEAGDVAGKRLVHLQCHFGLDTLSWARRGARVTGLDFSAPAVEAARALAARAGIDAEFVQADVYDAVATLGGRRFDVVYTGRGALNWLPDVDRWAAVMAGLLAPAGRFYLTEAHPVANVFADDSLTVTHPYFKPDGFVWDDDGGSYAEPDAATTHNRTIEWSHPIGAVVTALAAAGLRIELLHEHERTFAIGWPFLERDPGERLFRLPGDVPSLPLMYSLLATAPA